MVASPRADDQVEIRNVHPDKFPDASISLARLVSQLDWDDWMSCVNPQALQEEWTAILASAAPGARAIFRSAGLRVNYLDHLRVEHRGRHRDLGELLTYHPQLAAELHARDRVHTYGSFYIANLPR